MICLAAAACMTMAAPVFADELQKPDIEAHAAYVMDADTGDELYAKNADDLAIPAARPRL